MTSEPVFSPRLLIAWLAAAIIVFAISIYFMLRGDTGPGEEAIGPSTFSRSAIGHAGIAEVLQRLGVPVVKSRHKSVEQMQAGGLLVIAEPRPTSPAEETIRTLLNARTVLLVLPKWRGSPSDLHAGWIREADLAPISSARWALERAVTQGDVVREDQVTWTRNQLVAPPSLETPVQLVRSERLRPIVAAAQGILVGELIERNRRLWVLSDPDVMSNHGLARSGNAVFAVALINALRARNGGVVFDETVHGYVSRPASPWKLLFEFPYAVATIQFFMAMLLLLWATLARFGSPAQAPAALLAGKQALIENAARLIEFAGHQRVMVLRYVQATVRDVARQIHAPRGLTDSGLVEWLQRVGKARAVDVDCGDVLDRVQELATNRRADPRRLVHVAREIHRWKREIIDGPARDTRDHRGDPRRGPQGGGRPG